MFSKETYIQRRAALRNRLSSGIVLFLGNIDNPINFKDNCYPFRQDSTFLYYFGLSVPFIAAIIDLDEDKSIVFGDELSIDDIVWMGQQETLQAKCTKSGVAQTSPSGSLSTFIQKAIDSKRTIHFLPPYQSSSKIRLSELLQVPVSNLKPSVSLIKAVVAQRSIKEPQEITEIEKALQVATEMHLLAMRLGNIGTKEYEIVNAMQHYAGDHNCSFAYPPIVTRHGEILHNHHYHNTFGKGDMVLNDSGVETSLGYASDLTRTFPADTTFTPLQRDMYQIVLDSFESSRNLLQPGVSFKSIHLHATEILVQGLKDIGLMRGNVADAVAAHAHSLFFQCGLGHMMGLDVHDMEDLGEQYVGYTDENPKDTTTFGIKSLRLGKELEAGYVLTIEPGIYIIPELIDIWQAENKLAEFINYDKLKEFRHFGGIRIEDNFLITPEGYRLLGPELIKSVEDIENYKQAYA
ncbi:M24 family metallopeptidase [Sphingobacterium psychroaquaticum]|uniref:aminopeptidase P family protein n=1 Tax=Sphingobacterium psychroaquaticum TaxID=561061 RepID=UPI00106CE79A|nr:aminopeptidase P family protein [Sphingobacterium psychroaquaticum]QBQ41928.1 M24 family metallopeptidase [Sphingobacterium psychroaquaticum]